MTEETTLDERVRRGAALLDERAPAGWRGRIPVGESDFDMKSHRRCVAALACRTTFFTALRDLRLDPYADATGDTDDAVYCAGFDVSPSEANLDDDRAYRELTEAWLRYLDSDGDGR